MAIFSFGFGQDERKLMGISSAMTCANRLNMPVIVAASTLSVMAIRKRAVPIGTVGGAD